MKGRGFFFYDVLLLYTLFFQHPVIMVSSLLNKEMVIIYPSKSYLSYQEDLFTLYGNHYIKGRLYVHEYIHKKKYLLMPRHVRLYKKTHFLNL